MTNRNYNPLTIIILAFMFQSTKLLQSRKVALNGALAHRQSLRHSVCRRWQRLWFGIECESATSFLHIVILRIKDASFSFLLIGVWSMKRNTSINGLPGFVISILLPNTSIIGEEPHRLIFQTWLSSSQNSWKYYYSISFSPFQDDQRAASCMFRRESNHYSQTIRIWLC